MREGKLVDTRRQPAVKWLPECAKGCIIYTLRGCGDPKIPNDICSRPFSHDDRECGRTVYVMQALQGDFLRNHPISQDAYNEARHNALANREPFPGYNEAMRGTAPMVLFDLQRLDDEGMARPSAQTTEVLATAPTQPSALTPQHRSPFTHRLDNTVQAHGPSRGANNHSR